MGFLDSFRKKRGAKIFNKAGTKSILSNYKPKSLESFFQDWDDEIISAMDNEGNIVNGVKRFKQDIDLYRKITKNVPKVGAQIDTQAEFAIQPGFEILTEDDIESEKLKNEMRGDYELRAISRLRGLLTDGNVYYLNKDYPFKRLPTKHIRVRRDKKGKILGYVQIKGGRVVAKWKPDEIIHLKWNVYGTEPYGTSEIKRLTGVINKKLNMEEAEGAIFENYASPIIMLKIGTDESPASQSEIASIMDDWESRKIGGDIFAPGDWEAEVLAPAQGVRDAIELKKDIESQLESGLRMPVGTSDEGIEYMFNAFDRRIKTLQDIEVGFIENYIFPSLLNRQTNIPRVRFKPLDIEKLLRTARMVRQLVGSGNAPPVISRDEARDIIGLNPEGEDFYKEKEKGEDDANDNEDTE